MCARSNGDQYRTAQLPKNVVLVDITDGTAMVRNDDHLREIAEGNVYYVPANDVWLPRPVRGATVKCAIPTWLV